MAQHQPARRIHRSAVCAGLMVALLSLPMASVVLAQVDPVDGVVDDPTEPMDCPTDLLDGAIDDPTEPTECPTDAATDSANDPVEEVVEDVVDSVAAPVESLAPPPDDAAGGEPIADVDDPANPIADPAGDDGGPATAGTTPQPVEEPAAAAGPGGDVEQVEQVGQDVAIHTADTVGSALPDAGGSVDAAARRHGIELGPGIGGGFRSESGLRLQPFMPPVVSAPFTFQAPQVAGPDEATADGSAVASPRAATQQAAATPSVALQQTATTGPAGGPPGAIIATAVGLILLVGAGHALHATGRLERYLAKH